MWPNPQGILNGKLQFLCSVSNTVLFNTGGRKMRKENFLPKLIFKWDVLWDYVSFVQFKKRGNHPWSNVLFQYIYMLKPPTLLLLKIALLHGCFSRFLNCGNSNKSCKVSHTCILQIWFAIGLETVTATSTCSGTLKWNKSNYSRDLNSSYCQ